MVRARTDTHHALRTRKNIRAQATSLPQIFSNPLIPGINCITFPFSTQIGPLVEPAQIAQISEVSKSLETWLRLAHVSLPVASQDSSLEVASVGWADRLPLVAESLSAMFLEGLYSNNLLFYQRSCSLVNDIISALNMASAVRHSFSAISTGSCLHSIVTKLGEEFVVFNQVCYMLYGLKIAWENQFRIWRNTHNAEVVSILKQKLDILKTGRDNFLLRTTTPISITSTDLALLADEQRVSVGVLDAYVMILRDRFEHIPSVEGIFTCFLPTRFSSTYLAEYQSGSRKKTLTPIFKPDDSVASVDLRALQNRWCRGNLRLVVPMCRHHGHWIVAVIEGAHRRVTVLDSWEQTFTDSQRQRSGNLKYEFLVQTLQNMWEGLEKLWGGRERHETIPWTLQPHVEVPWQDAKNFYDCGIYMILFMIHLGYSPCINGDNVPVRYHIPKRSSNLAGFRLLLLDELQSDCL
ncbi:hypothetical protein GYMLUDRAFT_247609 [Collybiopsis luxurians FD-317 M1]|uniref:Ubiquitin-like protease family profile domain-containing protein n=1 Tax=Collybiopsis luxurians FD-317 M1 TaxID=944289 RepID=A0A0D0C3A1_9AGAR|nr:hypothetical protein GYMLUDRAFT_247609 [Collybiopsis luxurians FD-317 M1]